MHSFKYGRNYIREFTHQGENSREGLFQPKLMIEVNQPKSLLTQNNCKVPQQLRTENWEKEITGYFGLS
jgi:hypothetical protein